MKTERLTIRLLEGTDWQRMMALAADFEKSQYAIYDMPFPAEEDAARELTRQFAESGLFFAVFLPENPEMIGYVCFHNADGFYDLGFRFHSVYQGKGYACESCRALMEYLVRTRPVKGFTAGTALNNTPSCRLLEKLGFQCTATETLSFHKDAAGRDISFTGGLFACKPQK